VSGDATADGRTDDAPLAGSDGQAPLGGDAGTADNLEADNAAEQDMLETMDPEQPPA
jgi:hypothetical protein